MKQNNINSDRKHIFFFTFLLFLLTLVVRVPVYAQTVTISNVRPTSATRAADRQNQQLTGLKVRADQELNRRIAALNKLLVRLSEMKKLSPDQIATFKSQIQAEITSLTNLKAKTDADSDLPTLQADKKSIVASYRIFALFIPKMQLLAAADRMEIIADKLSDLATTLQSKIQQAQESGKDVTALQSSLSDMQAKLVDAKVQYNAVITEVTPLIPEGYPENKTILQDARLKLKAGAADLKTAHQDAKTIITGLKGMKVKLTPSVSPATPSATVTTQPSV